MNEIHSEKEQIFFLEKMIKEAGYPYCFNYNNEMPENINWGCYDFKIELGHLAGYDVPMLTIKFSDRGDTRLLKILDMRRALREGRELHFDNADITYGKTAQECMRVIERFFDTL